MIDRKQLEAVQRGNTAPGVNRLIIEQLISKWDAEQPGNLLDIPCGEGLFLDSVLRLLPGLKTFGADIRTPKSGFQHEYVQIDASRQASLFEGKKFQIITCISGVMEFDNTLSFFERLREQLDVGGQLIVSNDNLLSVRDRILYLLFGRHRQYKMAIPNDAPTWKIVPLQNLLRIMFEADLKVVEIKYVPPKTSDLLWSPLAALIYPFQYLYLRFAETSQDLSLKRSMFPFVSLLSRHYIVVCRPKAK